MTIKTKAATDAYREGFDRINWKDDAAGGELRPEDFPTAEEWERIRQENHDRIQVEALKRAGLTHVFGTATVPGEVMVHIDKIDRPCRGWFPDPPPVDAPLEAEVARLAADSPPSSDGWSAMDDTLHDADELESVPSSSTGST